jgi:hypothetical protein
MQVSLSMSSIILPFLMSTRLTTRQKRPIQHSRFLQVARYQCATTRQQEAAEVNEVTLLPAVWETPGIDIGGNRGVREASCSGTDRASKFRLRDVGLRNFGIGASAFSVCAIVPSELLRSLL